ncbi:uncharacterized protein BO66DRAFT_190618 [Aspergillus aculeatinus CBS 121060]|uniref:Uncharacterized protein n=1 Tax=Aspergillus aculeatinus CBS 121060 TaxID=1448322 RepID=A0ACD1GXJ2_9EURO|nr:hypothetical protein BO66DRAFT_190618 [Aspergillus aculeatinus CBS 121060]RAH66054.1 hypothetical protein BO66DRAFT_190618 [Aspergillus aculeatinus CBS 121060]
MQPQPHLALGWCWQKSARRRNAEQVGMASEEMLHTRLSGPGLLKRWSPAVSRSHLCLDRIVTILVTIVLMLSNQVPSIS